MVAGPEAQELASEARTSWGEVGLRGLGHTGFRGDYDFRVSGLGFRLRG